MADVPHAPSNTKYIHRVKQLTNNVFEQYSINEVSDCSGFYR